MHTFTTMEVLAVVSLSFFGGVLLTAGFCALILKAANNFNPFR